MERGEEFTRWARSVQPQLLRAAYLMSGDHHRAEDLVQEALTKVAVRWSRLRRSSPEAYARTVIYHDHVSWWRRRRYEVLTDRAVDAAVAASEPERRMVLQRALLTLPPRQRAVVVLRYFEDLTEHETARVLEVSTGTVKSQAHVALRRLRETCPELVGLWEEEAR